MTNEEFKSFIEELGITLTPHMEKQFERYYEMLIEKNKKINLTAITEKEMVYLKHFYDSATICKVIDLNSVETLCDVGTGAGFPGIVLKILFPKLKITLVDSLQKRVNFLNEVIKELGFENIEVIHERAEIFANTHREEYDIVTARAVAPLNILLEYCVPLVKVKKYFIPMKANISQEMNEAKNALQKLNCRIVERAEFLLPKENSIRNILLIEKLKQTEKKFPRKFSEIKKRPL